MQPKALVYGFGVLEMCIAAVLSRVALGRYQIFQTYLSQGALLRVDVLCGKYSQGKHQESYCARKLSGTPNFTQGSLQPYSSLAGFQAHNRGGAVCEGKLLLRRNPFELSGSKRTVQDAPCQAVNRRTDEFVGWQIQALVSDFYTLTDNAGKTCP